MLKSMGGLEQQRAYIMKTKNGHRVHIYETPRGAPDAAEQKYTIGDAWRLRLLLLKQLNAIVKAATESTREENEWETGISAEAESTEGGPQGADGTLGGGGPPPSIAFQEKRAEDRYVLYLHGGAFISQSPDFYRIFLNGIDPKP